MGLGCRRSGGACPGETDQRIHSPPVAEGLWGVAEAQPADRDQVFAGGFDAAQVHAKDLGNPGGLAPATADAAMVLVVEAAEQMPEHGGDDGGFETARDEADRLARHWHPPVRVGGRLEHGLEAGEVLDLPQIGGGGGKRESGTGPSEKAEGVEATNGGPEMFPTYPTNEPVEFTWRVVRDLASGDLASPRDHLLGGKPNPEVHELDEPRTIGPPEETELLNRQKHEAPLWLSCLIRSILHGGYIASLVWKQTERGCPHTP